MPQKIHFPYIVELYTYYRPEPAQRNANFVPKTGSFGAAGISSNVIRFLIGGGGGKASSIAFLLLLLATLPTFVVEKAPHKRRRPLHTILLKSVRPQNIINKF